MSNKRRLPEGIRDRLDRALEIVQMKRCGVDPEHQEAMKLYLDTWAVGPLQMVIDWDDKKIPAPKPEVWP